MPNADAFFKKVSEYFILNKSGNKKEMFKNIFLHAHNGDFGKAKICICHFLKPKSSLYLYF